MPPVDSQKILLIDDEPTLHDLARAFLEKAGYHLLSAYDGPSGLDLLLREKPALVLLDLLMPEMNGEQVFNELTGNPRYEPVRNIPVIMLTGHEADGLMKTKLMARGVSAYLRKPFGWRELANVIENLFIIHDIRQRNLQLRAEVEATRDYLALILNNAPIGIFSTDARGQIREANPMVCQLMGFASPESMAGKSVFEKKSLRETFLRTAATRVMTGHKPWKVQGFNFRKSDGQMALLNIHAVPLWQSQQKEGGSESLAGVLGIVEDVTEGQKHDYQLRMLTTIGLAMQSAINLDELLHLILTGITAGPALGFNRAMIFLIDDTGLYLAGRMGVGPADGEEARRIWQTLSEEHITLEDFLEKYGKRRPARDDAFNNRIRAQKLLLTAGDSDFVATIRRKKPYRGLPEQRVCASCQKFFENLELKDFIAVPLVAKDRLIGMIIADYLYSQQKIDADALASLEIFASQAAHAIEKADANRRLEEDKYKLEAAYKELQTTHDRLVHAERLAAVGNMAGHVAHEIRNPLVAIGGFARSLMRLAKDNASIHNVAQIIAEEVMRLEKILANVMLFTKFPKPSFQFADLNTTIEEACKLLQSEAEQHNVKLIKTLAPGLPKLLLDPIQINQMLVNLMRNGIQSISGYGVVEVSTQFVEPQEVLLVVRDTGSGIPANVLDNLFNPFFTTKPDGTGLGLAICQQIVGDHGSRIGVDSQVGHGTVFSISFPVPRNQNTAPNQTLKKTSKISLIENVFA
ncbi:response regulator [candidate division KSB1 bacterium]|nr:response regulator [candidate division KSB1 bacterium]